jgi:ATP-dependent exoDNAse (exonuclease V) beta subunit
MTGHKAKGLEFDVVYHLDRHLIRLGEEQEDNLRYVIDTRAKDELYYITSAGVI